MAIVQSTNVIELSGTIANFDLIDVRPIKLIIFEPGATNDSLIIRDESSTGPRFFEVSATDTNDQRILYLDNAALRPVITVSECILSTGSKIIFLLGKY